MTEISSTSLMKLQHIFNLIGRRIVPCYFFTHNRTEYLKWQFNACRQTGLICAYFLDKLATNINSCEPTNFNVQLYDGYFTSMFDKEYNHAWAFMSRGDEFAKGLLVDVARVTYPNLFVWNTINTPARLLEQSTTTPWDVASGGEDIRIFEDLKKRTRLDWYTMLDEKEYFTGKTGLEICKDIELLLQAYSIDFSTFDLNQKNETHR